jgi:hypothetical protein
MAPLGPPAIAYLTEGTKMYCIFTPRVEYGTVLQGNLALQGKRWKVARPPAATTDLQGKAQLTAVLQGKSRR